MRISTRRSKASCRRQDRTTTAWTGRKGRGSICLSSRLPIQGREDLGHRSCSCGRAWRSLSSRITDPLPPGTWELKLLRAEDRTAAAATSEPFGPSSFIELAEINLTAPEAGRYYAAVFSNASTRPGNNISAGAGGSGHYGLAVGYKEEFSFTDRFVTPLRLISVYLWEGQSLSMILIPYLLAEAIALLFFWRGSRRTSFCLAGLLAGFLFLATSASAFNQMAFSLTRAPLGPEVYITLAIGLFHALLGVAAIRLARGEAGILQRALLAVIGTIALLAGSGLIIGPMLSMAASFLPSRSGNIFARNKAQEKK